MDLGMSGRVAFITGASKGIGRETARVLAEEGARVAITARNDEALQQAAKELSEQTGGEVIGIAGDMSVAEDVERCVQAASDRLGAIDILVTCAGSSPGGLLEELTEEQWLQSLNLKFLGYVRTCRAVIPRMVENGGGRVVLVVGNDGLKPSYWEMTAGAANAADLNFASSLAEQYGPDGVRINTVNPGPVDTDRWDGLEKAFARDMGTDQATARSLANASIPLGRICRPEEVADLVAYLASDRAAYITATTIPIDGGLLHAI